MGKLKLGNGLDPETDIAPMRRDHFRSKVESQIRQALEAGAKVLTDGKRPVQFEKDFNLEPTVMVNVDYTMEIIRDETSGPVIPLMPYKGFDEAITLANNSQYGL